MRSLSRCIRSPKVQGDKVEHSIGVLKRIFGFDKVRYRGIAKNANRLFVTCTQARLFMARRHLFRAQGT
jgi:IS5 family transposase